MQSKILRINSEILETNLEVLSYGHYGTAILMFPGLSDSPYIYEENNTLHEVNEYIKRGRCRIFVAQTLNNDIWFSDKYSNREKAQKFSDYFSFVSEELVQLIYSQCNGPVPIITLGASIGGFIAANAYFKRPDNFLGTISLSGFFNIHHLCKDYYDDNCYFNSPEHYVPNLNDSFWLSYLISRHHVYLYGGSGENEHPDNSRVMSDILNAKGIKNNLEIWGDEYGHNYESWNKMIVSILNSKI